jgi:adenylylsulfate kinase
MGLPGSGKTTLAKELSNILLNSSWFNADEVRKANNDWDFSEEGRLRQAYRMLELANESNSPYAICDFVAPTEKIRNIFNADFVIWMDTIKLGRFEDTNKIFEIPIKYNLRLINFNYDIQAIEKLIVH